MAAPDDGPYGPAEEGAYAGGTVSRKTWPLTGRTGGTTSSGSPASRPLRLPAASTTWSAPTFVPSPSTTPVARPPLTVSRTAEALRNTTPARSHATSSAAASRRGSTWWSPSTRSPPRTPGASIGSRRRHSRPLSQTDSSPERSWRACSSRRCARSSESSATASVPQVRNPVSRPLAASSSATNSG